MSEAIEQYRCILDSFKSRGVSRVSVGDDVHAIFLAIFEYGVGVLKVLFAKPCLERAIDTLELFYLVFAKAV